MTEPITRCPSCDGYGWLTDEFTAETGDCEWCKGTGYVYRGEDGIDRPIPEADYGKVSAVLEGLEHERLREMGYSGSAIHPDAQEIRKEAREAKSNEGSEE